MTTDEPLQPGEYYEQLSLITKTIESVREALESDHTLTTDQWVFACRLVFLSSQPLKEADQLLPDPHQTGEPQDAPVPESWNDYDDALTHIERHLCWLIDSLQAEQIDEHRDTDDLESKFTTALEHITALRDILPEVSAESPVLAEMETVRIDGADPHVGGRGDSKGRWLEYQLQRALTRWGYSAETRQRLFSLEVDVVAARRTKQQEPSDWIVAQCKDWTSDQITPAILFRLCTVAFACRAMPILCHTTELTPRTEELAREFEVRVLELKDLERAELPAPQVAKPTRELEEWRPQYRARDDRGSLPLMFRGGPGKRFSYVPGFTPVGKDADYEPIESDRDDDTHPAAGH